MRYGVWRRRRVSVGSILIVCALCAGIGLLMLNLRQVDPPTSPDFYLQIENLGSDSDSENGGGVERETEPHGKSKRKSSTCATVEEMGKEFEGGGFWEESLRVRKFIQHHFDLNGASRVRNLPPEQFCRHGFVMGKASEAGFGNEMYKILSGAALSIMLNRSLIIGQTRGKFPFGNYISYSKFSFTMREIKHLWRLNKCVKKYGRQLVMRTDDFEKPAQTNVLCSNWMKWKQPIIWFQGTNDAVAAQFFLKNIHPQMRNAASAIFGKPEVLNSRPNVFGELMRVLITPSEDVQEAVNWVLGGAEPDISLHMRMLMNKSVRAAQAAVKCIKKAMHNVGKSPKPRVVLASDNPSLVKSITPTISKFAEVIHFDYELFKGNISSGRKGLHGLDFRVKDWGPAPRWVAFVDFFLASRAKHAVVSGAHRRVGTTYAQLIAALAAANSLGDKPTGSSFAFLSSFQGDLLRGGLRFQIGWGHVWNRFAGPLGCHGQPNQCAFTPLLPPAWWDGLWQSPLPRDIKRLAEYGIELSGFGTINENHLQSFCSSKKVVVKTIPFPL
ncbi:uncharacterized protein [Pyrus communis]|uniref:uncharacterized protein n=1 Tax=Pyrus communis TaxID=23211 RepID=UPI0035BF0A32